MNDQYEGSGLTMQQVPKGQLTAAEFFEWLHSADRADNLWELHRGCVVPETRHEPAYYSLSHGIVSALTDRLKAGGSVACVVSGIGTKVESEPDTVQKVAVAVLKDEQHYDALEEGLAGSPPPLMAVELEEPGKSYGIMARRVAGLVASGVRLVWWVHPGQRALSIFHGREPVRVADGRHEVSGEEVLPELRIPVAELFAQTSTYAREQDSHQAE